MLQMSVRGDYATFNFNAISSSSSSDPLRRWLEGRWALLFSHPGDFAAAGFEADRWLVYVRDAFASLPVRPIGIGGGDGAGWISQTGGRLVPHDVAEDFLPAEVRETSEHFVTILDSTLRARRTLLYTPGIDVPCAIELAHTAAHQRTRGGSPSVRRILQGV
ncbi:hypothetical protein JM946_17015 [Steroidobacter sp. S1-65]|uniref:Uncharacterized protein n=1 Tax=Steroidobacter gossypii TaxID=2805490 RepID=A0ABS1WZM1_9GAMM|nr:hypothetical protein [Steroidobacter gossypii]MBM0106434.1 hypothetical protein [Steroidobacter gossypii]